MYLRERLTDTYLVRTSSEDDAGASVKFEPIAGCQCAACCVGGGGTSSFTGSTQLGNGPNPGNPYGKLSGSYDDVATHLNRTGASWNTTDGSGTTVITYAFRETVSSQNEPGFTVFNADQIAAAEAALAMFSLVADIEFVRVDDGDGYSDNAAILFGNRTGSGQAYAYLPSSGNESDSSLQGDIWIYSSAGSNFDLDPGGYGLLTMIHEIGHAVGLSHPGAYNGTGSYTSDAEYYEDTRQYTVMSYFDESITGANFGSFYNSGLALHDLAALQQMYGANTDVNSGNNRFGFNNNAGDMYELSSASDDLTAVIWDNGGFDWLDFSGYADDQEINLNELAFSSVGGLTYNISIARGVEIEGAEGGSGEDTLIGNDLGNRFWGNESDDTITGGNGVDRAYFSGAESEYTITRLTTGGFTVAHSGTDGTDTTFNVRYLHFSDGIVDVTREIAGNRKVTIADFGDIELNPTSSTNVFNLFDVSDPDADTVTLYRFKYSSDDVGTVFRNGVALNAGQWYNIQVADIESLTYVANYTGGDGPGQYADQTQMQLRAADGGGGFSLVGRVWIRVRDLAVNAVPTLSANSANVDLDNSQSGEVMSFFSFADSDGDPIDRIRVRVRDSGGASVEVNGVDIGVGTAWTTVLAADLTTALVVGGADNTGPTTIEVQAYDGYDWSSTAGIEVTGDYSNNTSSTAVLTAGSSFTSSLYANGDRDYVAIDLVSGQTYTFDLQGSPSGNGTLSDPYLRLYGTNGTTLEAQNDDIQLGVQLESRITFTATSTGTYYLSVGAYADSSNGTYLLTASPGSQSAPSAETSVTAPAANAADGSDWTSRVDTAALNGPDAGLSAASPEWNSGRFGSYMYASIVSA